MKYMALRTGLEWGLEDGSVERENRSVSSDLYIVITDQRHVTTFFWIVQISYRLESALIICGRRISILWIKALWVKTATILTSNDNKRETIFHGGPDEDVGRQILKSEPQTPSVGDARQKRKHRNTFTAWLWATPVQSKGFLFTVMYWKKIQRKSPLLAEYCQKN